MADVSKKNRPNHTILLVEDDDMVRQVVKVMLKRLGFKVFETEDGIKAIEIFRKYKDEISCVLCDLMMPGMNGFELLARLREFESEKPFILMSAYNDLKIKADEHRGFFQAFLTKPFALEELSNTLKEVL